MMRHSYYYRIFVFTCSSFLAGIATVTSAAPIAGVDFEGSSASVFDRSPDDLDLTDGITVSSGTNSGVGLWDGWTLSRTNGSSPASGNLRSDNGATSAGATSPDFPARLESNAIGSWSIFVADDVLLDLDRIEFDVRGATSGTGRDVEFNTSLDGTNVLFADTNLNGRTAGFQHVVVDLSAALYQDLTDQEVAFNWFTPNAIDLDTIELFGTVSALVVPEPTSIAIWSLFGIGFVAYGVYRWRSTQKME